jgi:hypothetical protein
MKTRSIALLLALAVLGGAFAASAGAALVGIYRNGMDSTAQRGQLVKLAGRSCARGGADSALRIAIGEKTDACAYRTPVLGRDLEVAATERLLSGTPTALQRRAYLGLELRAGAGAKYQLLVYPLQRKVQLVKVTAGVTKYLAIVKNQAAVMGVNKANALRLRAVNASTGPERGSATVVGFLGKTKVVEASDATSGELTGRASTVLVGAPNNADGLIASVDDVIVRVPSPF